MATAAALCLVVALCAARGVLGAGAERGVRGAGEERGVRGAGVERGVRRVGAERGVRGAVSERRAFADDAEWNEMVLTNPYPAVCAPIAFPEKDALRICILEHMWIDELPTEMPRMSPGLYNFKSSQSKILPQRKITDPRNRLDCLWSTRGRSSVQVPYQCYPEAGIDPNTEWQTFNPQFGQSFNDLRFTFDFVLHEDPDIYIENNLWYLILYLKKIAIELQSPYDLIRVINSDAKHKLDADNKFEDLKNKISLVKIESTERFQTLYKALEGIKKSTEIILSNRMNN